MTRLSVIGMLLHQYYHYKYKQKIKTLTSEIICNPENPEKVHNKLVYLNGELNTEKKPTEDYELGYTINTISLIRIVEKLQWKKVQNNFFKVWSTEPLTTTHYPESFRSTPWIYHSKSYKSQSFTKINKCYISTSKLIKAFGYDKCDVSELRASNSFLEPPEGLNKVLGKDYIILETKDYGVYKVYYKYIKDNKRLTVLGLLDEMILSKKFNVFIEKGDVPLDQMIAKIDSSADKRLTIALLMVFLCGVGIEYI
jgi:hypothetical protein